MRDEPEPRITEQGIDGDGPFLEVEGAGEKPGTFELFGIRWRRDPENEMPPEGEELIAVLGCEPTLISQAGKVIYRPDYGDER